MSESIPTPEKIWIITGETHSQEAARGGRSGSQDTGGLLGSDTSEETETVSTDRKPVEVDKLKREMKGFLRAQFEKPLLETGDNLWFFFAGHGRRDQEQDYLMLSDSDPGDVEHTAISVDYVSQRLRRSGADNVILFLDACRDESRRGEGIRAKYKGVVTFYSCSPKQRAYEIEEYQHGSFTYALLEGLRIQGEGNCATVERLEQYLRSRVAEITYKHWKQEQNPYASSEPATKLHLILLPDYATLTDTATLRLDAFQAEAEGNLLLAEQLWIRVLAISRGDLDAIAGIKRIARRPDRIVALSKLIPRKHFLKLLGLGGGGLVTALLVREIFEQPASISVAEPKYFAPTEESAKVNGLPLWRVEFETVTVDSRGKVIKRHYNRQAKFFKENLDNGITLDMVSIPGGSFMMGSPEGEGSKDEKPQHPVTVQAFYMGKYPITQKQYQKIMNTNPSNFKGDDLPVEKVSWEDAVEFCQRLSQKTGKEYRLPTEAEWEYACRARTDTPFHFGKTITGDLANYRAIYTYANEPQGEYRRKTTPVGSFPPNAFSLYDMHGNVSEWCEDDWHDNYEGAPTDGSAWTSGSSSIKVRCSGSWGYHPLRCRSALRDYDLRVFRTFLFGFRVACVFPRTT